MEEGKGTKFLVVVFPYTIQIMDMPDYEFEAWSLISDKLKLPVGGASMEVSFTYELEKDLTPKQLDKISHLEFYIRDEECNKLFISDEYDRKH